MDPPWREPLHRDFESADVDFESADEIGSVSDYDPEGVPSRPPAKQGEAARRDEMDDERQLQEVQVRGARSERGRGRSQWVSSHRRTPTHVSACVVSWRSCCRIQNPL